VRWKRAMPGYKTGGEMKRFSIEGLRVLEGPSYYLERPALVFDLVVHGKPPRVGDLRSRPISASLRHD
jgi:hypothetical protein